MLIVSGEVRKIVDKSYSDKKTGQKIKQAAIVIEPVQGSQNYEVYLNRTQSNDKTLLHWENLKGSKAAIEVTLYVNYKYGFHKFSALGTAEPLSMEVIL